MIMKLIRGQLMLVVLAVLAFPATASASNDPQLTVSGFLVAAGNKIVGTSIFGAQLKNTSGNTTLVNCSNSTMTGTLLKNASGTVEAEISTWKFWGDGSTSAHNNLPECTGSFGNAYLTMSTPLCIKSTPAMSTDEFQIIGGSCGVFTSSVTYIVGSTTAGSCKYKATTSLKGDFWTGGVEVHMTIRELWFENGATLEEGGFLCPTSNALNMTFNIESETGTGLTIS
ncbi:MAG TPA: hypothetical protein VFX35_02715 [Solirubrobacterales bacterium]|nr:hypothetical protein [Solirubrobacterales bacterium]